MSTSWRGDSHRDWSNSWISSLHLYNQGQEVATSDLVEAQFSTLTGDAKCLRTTSRMEYVAAHGKQSRLPPSPLMERVQLPLPTFASRLAEGRYRDTVYVRVSKDGLADDAFSDVACSRRIDDPYLQSVVKSIRFKPALNNGKPVEGIAPLKLGDLAI